MYACDVKICCVSCCGLHAPENIEKGCFRLNSQLKGLLGFQCTFVPLALEPVAACKCCQTDLSSKLQESQTTLSGQKRNNKKTICLLVPLWDTHETALWGKRTKNDSPVPRLIAIPIEVGQLNRAGTVLRPAVAHMGQSTALQVGQKKQNNL